MAKPVTATDVRKNPSEAPEDPAPTPAQPTRDEFGIETAPIVERKRYLLKVVDRIVQGTKIAAPFHNHAVAGWNFSRFSMRPSPGGELDERGELLWQRIPGQIANLTEDEHKAIVDRLAQRFIAWRPGTRGPTKAGEKPVIDPYFRGEVKIVPEGRRPEAGWHPASLYLRIEEFPETPIYP